MFLLLKSCGSNREVVAQCRIEMSILLLFSFQMLGGYGEFMYQTGMIDELQKQYVVQQTDLGVKLIQQQKWVEAFQVRDAGCLFDL